MFIHSDMTLLPHIFNNLLLHLPLSIPIQPHFSSIHLLAFSNIHSTTHYEQPFTPTSQHWNKHVLQTAYGITHSLEAAETNGTTKYQ